MKKNEIELKIQALVDDELTELEAGQLREQIESDPELKIVHERLMQIRDLISENEVPYALPTTGDFYWAKIVQCIDKKELSNHPPNGFLTEIKPLFRWLVPLLGCASVVLFLVLQQPAGPDLGIVLNSDHELELTSDEIDVMTFNSDDDSMSIVWLDYSMDIQNDYMELWLD